MSTVTKNPLCDFRAVNAPAAGVKATATTTAPTASTYPPGNNQVPFLVVQDICACLVAGTAGQTALTVNLIDGTTGGTNIVWTGILGAGTGVGVNVAQSYLNIPCKSGFATLEFSSAGGTLSSQSISFGGYYSGGMGGN